MGKVVPGAQMSGQRYRIGVPVVKPAYYADQAVEAEPESGVDIEDVVAAAHRIIDDSSNDARSLINDARERAKHIVGKALDMAAELESKGYEDGLARGRDDSRRAVDEALDETRATLEKFVESVREERRQFFRHADDDVLRLAMTIAKKIVQREVERTDETIVAVTRAALKRLSERNDVTIRVAPQDLEAIRAQRESFLHEGDIENLKVVADPRVDRGGVLIETESGSIDGRLDAQLQVAQDAIRANLGMGTPGPA